MNLTAIKKVVHLGRDTEAREACQRARELENVGDFEGAREELSGFWALIGERPQLEGLEGHTQAELLLRVGSLSGSLGSARQISNAQEFAKDLITEANRRFESLGDYEKLAEAQTDLDLLLARRLNG